MLPLKKFKINIIQGEMSFIVALFFPKYLTLYEEKKMYVSTLSL